MAGAVIDHSGVRRQRLLSDVDLIVHTCTADKDNPFCRKYCVFVTPFTFTCSVLAPEDFMQRSSGWGRTHIKVNVSNTNYWYHY